MSNATIRIPFFGIKTGGVGTAATWAMDGNGDVITRTSRRSLEERIKTPLFALSIDPAKCTVELFEVVEFQLTDLEILIGGKG